MIAVHIISKDDVNTFRYIYEDIPGISIYQNIEKDMLMEILERNPRKDIIFIGYGDRNGLFDAKRENYVVDKEVVPLLLDRKVIGIWCYASEFADINGLHGFFTSNFISNLDEYNQTSSTNTLGDITEEDIINLNYIFSKRVEGLIEKRVDLSLWVNELQSEVTAKSSLIEKHNYETLSYYE